jgi:hypothetical protein
MARSSQLNVCLLTLMANSSHTHCARSIRRLLSLSKGNDAVQRQDRTALNDLRQSLSLVVIQQWGPAGR